MKARELWSPHIFESKSLSSQRNHLSSSGISSPFNVSTFTFCLQLFYALFTTTIMSSSKRAEKEAKSSLFSPSSHSLTLYPLNSWMYPHLSLCNLNAIEVAMAKLTAQITPSLWLWFNSSSPSSFESWHIPTFLTHTQGILYSWCTILAFVNYPERGSLDDRSCLTEILTKVK